MSRIDLFATIADRWSGVSPVRPCPLQSAEVRRHAWSP